MGICDGLPFRANHVSWRAGRGVASQHECTCRPGWTLAACVLKTDRGRSVQPIGVDAESSPRSRLRNCCEPLRWAFCIAFSAVCQRVGRFVVLLCKDCACVRSRDQTAGRWLQSDDAAVYGDPRAGLRGRRGGDQVAVRQVRLRGSLAGRRSSCAALAERRHGGDYRASHLTGVGWTTIAAGPRPRRARALRACARAWGKDLGRAAGFPIRRAPVHR